MLVKYQFCDQLGYNGNSDQGCVVFAKWTLYQQASQRSSEDNIKTNTNKFLVSIKQRQSEVRQHNQLKHRITKLKWLDKSLDLTAVINFLQLLTDDSDNDDYSDSEDDEWEAQAKEIPKDDIQPETPPS